MENDHKESNVVCERCNYRRERSRHARKCTGRFAVCRDHQGRCAEASCLDTDILERSALLELAENYQEACITTNTKLPITAISQINESPK